MACTGMGDTMKSWGTPWNGVPRDSERKSYIMPFRAFLRARFFAASAFFLRLTDGFS